MKFILMITLLTLTACSTKTTEPSIKVHVHATTMEDGSIMVHETITVDGKLKVDQTVKGN